MVSRAHADYLFEVSWETCNKVGGIYTVIKSKAALMVEHYKNYLLIGPYVPHQAKVEMDEEPAPEPWAKIFAKLKPLGITCYYGTWQIKGEPKVILLDTNGLVPKKNEIKTILWETYRIDSLFSGWDFEEPMVWSWAVGMLLEAFAKEHPNKKIVGQFHEWLAGFGALYLKRNKVPIATVFTTHATMLGRSICGSGGDLYAMLDMLNPYEEAKRLGVMDKFTTERACAQQVEIFTTVSEITGIEAEKILGRKPEVLVLNGLDLSKFPTFEEASTRHVTYRDRIREFQSYYFYPYYHFEMEHNLIFSIFGRYEFRNKGIDIFISALGKLNTMLKERNAERTVTAFFFIPAGIKGVNMEVMTNKVFYRHIKDYVKRNADQIEQTIVNNIISGKGLSAQDLFSQEFINNNKKHLLSFRKKGLPPLSTHYLEDEANDQIINAFKANGLNNSQENKVKVILYPVYMNGVDGLLDLDYYNVISGSHLGIYPSYYEPWGYTPLESAAMAVPAVTTDLSGFGRFILQDERVNKSGIFVLRRLGRKDQDVINEFAELLFNFSRLTKHERAKQKIDAKELAELADWKELIDNYIVAHNKALERIK